MSNKKSIIEKIKMIFNEDLTQETFLDVKCQDGTILRVDDMVVGAKAEQVTEDGIVNVADGEYLTSEGVKVQVANGMIENIMSPEDVVDETMGYENKEKMEDGYKNEIDTKLVDGTEVRVLTKGEAVSVGDMVLVKAGEGYVEAPEGRHELEGGLVVYTDAEGNINEIETKETEERDEVDMEEVFSSISKLIDEVMSLKEEVKSVKEENTSLKERFNKFAAQPSAEPVKTKVEFKNLNNKEEKLKFFGGK
jgi:hypothetical protein